MPWLALPFSDRERKEKLGELFECQGIPYLVLLKPNGEIISKNGRSVVTGDNTGENFPWPPKSLTEVLGTTFEKKGKQLTFEKDLAGKIFGVYFSAHWCPPCRGFTPKLAQAYKKLTEEQKKDFEIVFASSDRDQKSFEEYAAEMPWAVIPYADRARKDALSSFFEVEGIPTLVLIDATEKGAEPKVISTEAVGAVHKDFEKCENFPWKNDNAVTTVSEIDESCDNIMDNPTLMVYQPDAPESEKKMNTAVMTKLALAQTEALKKAKEETNKANGGKPAVETCFDAPKAESTFNFYMASKDGRLAGRIGSECGFSSAAKKDQKVHIALLCIHKGGKFFPWMTEEGEPLPFTKENAEKFIQLYKDGKLGTPKKMGEADE